MLTISNLTYRIQGRALFENASLVLPTGSKTGFVGKNGTGKTTLFHLIQGHLAAEGGSIEVVRRARIGAVAQEAVASEVSVLDVVLSADKERTSLLAEAEHATDPHRIGDIHTRLAEIDAHTAEARASTILKGLGFEKDRQLAPTAELSGGWRMRVSLAGVLFSQPDLLLLDEPTNYLDLEGTLWLEKYLATYPYTVFMISHDRDLLNKAVTSIVASRAQEAHLLPRQLRHVRGDAADADGAQQQGPREDARPDRAPAEIRRPLQGQGFQGQAGAGARQDDREAEAAGGDVRRELVALQLPATPRRSRPRR